MLLNLIERLFLRVQMYALDIHVNDMNEVLQHPLDIDLRLVIESNRAAARIERKAIGERYHALRRAAKAKRDPKTA